MSQTNTMTTLEGMFKRVYLEKSDIPLDKLIPMVDKLQAMIPFNKRKKLGKVINFPVQFTLEHGFTFGAPGDDKLTLNTAIASQSEEAEVDAYQLVLKSEITFKAAQRAEAGDEASFIEETAHLVKTMVASFRKRLEILMLYGKDGLAVRDTTVAAVDNGSTCTITLTKASFASGIWAGMELMHVDVEKADGTGNVTGGGDVEVTVIDIENRKITLNADLESVITASGAVKLFFANSGRGTKEMPGIKKILTASTSGEAYFGIDPSQYSLWRGTQYALSSASALSFEILQKAIARGVAKGLEGKVSVLVSTLHWADLMNDEAALRKYDQSYSKKKLSNGSEYLEFISQNGVLEIVPHTMVKGGDCFVINAEDWDRVGSVDVTFTLPGRGGQIFSWPGTETAYIYAAYTDQTIFCKKPAAQVYISNLTYND